MPDPASVGSEPSLPAGLRRTPRVVAFALILSVPVMSAEAAWEKYVPRKLGAVIALNASLAPTKVGDTLILGDTFPSRTRVVSRGRIRALAGERLDFVVRYFLKARSRPDWAQLFKREVLVEEDGSERWIPIQESLASDFTKEVGQGVTVVVYVSCIGAVKTTDSTEWLFLMNGFDHVEPPAEK